MGDVDPRVSRYTQDTGVAASPESRRPRNTVDVPSTRDGVKKFAEFLSDLDHAAGTPVGGVGCRAMR
jgi:hypothetical protein